MYVISDPAQPHVALGTASTLGGIANALAARPEPNLEVYVSKDGHSRTLDAAEQVELDERLRAAPLCLLKERVVEKLIQAEAGSVVEDIE